MTSSLLSARHHTTKSSHDTGRYHNMLVGVIHNRRSSTHQSVACERRKYAATVPRHKRTTHDVPTTLHQMAVVPHHGAPPVRSGLAKIISYAKTKCLSKYFSHRKPRSQITLWRSQLAQILANHRGHVGRDLGENNFALVLKTGPHCISNHMGQPAVEIFKTNRVVTKKKNAMLRKNIYTQHNNAHQEIHINKKKTKKEKLYKK